MENNVTAESGSDEAEINMPEEQKEKNIIHLSDPQ